MSETALLPAPECHASERDDQWERERQAFLSLESSLLQTHCGQFVAVHNGQVVDCDGDEVQLGLRVYGKYGYRPLDDFLTGERTLRSDVLDRLVGVLGYELQPVG